MNALGTLLRLLEERHENRGLSVLLSDGLLRGYLKGQLVAEVDCGRLEKRSLASGPNIGELCQAIFNDFDEQVEANELNMRLPERVRESAYR